MTTLGIAHINFHAHRELLDAMKDFYRDVVGLEIGHRPQFAMFGYWLYAGTQPIVHLYEAKPDEIRRTDADGTFDHVAFVCQNIEAVEARLRSHGTTYRKATVPGSNLTQLFLQDPAGNTVELNFEGD